MAGVVSFLGSLVSPVTTLIDKMHTSEDEKNAAKAALVRIENEAAARLLDYERQVLDLQARSIIAEAQGSSWLQRSWRPITMLTFLALVVADSFGVLAFRLSGEAWTLLKIGIGGYVVGRSAEKLGVSLKDLKGG